MKLTRTQCLLLSLLSGVLLSAGWPAHGFPFLLLIGFSPLLLVEEHISQLRQPTPKKAPRFFGYAYFAMLLWNTLTTWWVCNSTIVGGILAIVLNSLFMALILLLFHAVKRRLGGFMGYFGLIFFWLTFEYLHLNWQLSWPWLTLGFGFANYTSCIQWYQFTGPLGGSLWILLCNILIFRLFLFKKGWISTTIVFLLPVIISVLIFIQRKNISYPKGKDFVVVQPNIDPYNEKFNGDFKSQLYKMLQLADRKVDSNSGYLIFPETALTEDIWENNITENASIPILKKYLTKYPRLTIITGASTCKAYKQGDTLPESARKYPDADGYYDYFNTALQMDTSNRIELYHKSKLVPGVEFMPFAKLLAPLGKVAFDLGGTSGTLGTQKEPSVFCSAPNLKTGNKGVTVAPAICYESIYGEYIGKYIKKGAQIIVVITNDGWWDDTPGYRQHLSYARLLGVETRKYVVQCANTGFSAFIDPLGNVSEQTKWWQPDVIKASVPASDEVTFYVRYGDYIGLLSCWVSLIIFFLFLVKLIILRSSFLKNQANMPL